MFTQVKEIDAYWLQRRIGKALGSETDADRSQLLAEEVLTVLGGPADQRGVENSLVTALGFEQFELIKELIRNRSVLAQHVRHSWKFEDLSALILYLSF